MRKKTGVGPWEELRERENRECLGGMRNPHTAVKKMHRLREVGRHIREVIDEVLTEDCSLLGIVDKLRTDGVNSPEEVDEVISTSVQTAAERVAKKLGNPSAHAKKPPKDWRTDLIRQINQGAR